MSLKNIIVGTSIIIWLILSVIFDINPYIAYTILGIIIIVWLVSTVLAWKTKSEKRGDSWEGSKIWVESLLDWKQGMFK